MTNDSPRIGGRDRRPFTIASGTRLALIRHGEAFCNVNSYIGGHQGCEGLTERGIRQAEALAARLERTGELAEAAALYTSILPRAIATAAIVEPALGTAATATRWCELCERHPGEADGLSWAEFESRYGRQALPGDDPDLPLSPGGESWVDFLDRAAAALLAVAAAHPGELAVVVSHGGVIDASMIRFLGLARHGAGVRLHPEHTSITEWESTGTMWRLVRYSDAAHLVLAGQQDLSTTPPDWVRASPSELNAQQV